MPTRTPITLHGEVVMTGRALSIPLRGVRGGPRLNRTLAQDMVCQTAQAGYVSRDEDGCCLFVAEVRGGAEGFDRLLLWLVENGYPHRVVRSARSREDHPPYR